MTILTDETTAVSRAIEDGQCVYLAGFSHLVPTALGHEIVRQGIADLELARLAPDPIYDQLIAAGSVSTATFSWAGNPGIGNLGAFRRAVEERIPQPIAVEEYTHFGLLSRLAAGARGYPFLPVRTFVGSDLLDHREDVRQVEIPYEGRRNEKGKRGESVPVVPPLTPDVALCHAQQADEEGNARAWGIVGDLPEALFAADTVIVSVEEVIEKPIGREGAGDGGTVLPAGEIDYVVETPFGSHPAYAQGYYGRDTDAYLAWDECSRDRAATEEWLDEWVYGVADRRAYCERLGDDRLDALRSGVGGVRSPETDRSRAGRTDRTGRSPVTTNETNEASEPGEAGEGVDPTRTELMVASAARELAEEDTVLVGVGLPILACLLASRTHAPGMRMLYESGAIEANPESVPYSTASPKIATSARTIVPMYDVLTHYLQAGRIDVGFLGGAQVDRWGNVNSTVIGEYDAPKVRLPGSGGACGIASNTDRTIIITPHERRRLPGQVDFVTSPGYVEGREGRAERGLKGGPSVVLTDKAVLRFDDRGEAYAETLHPGVSREEVQEATGWELRFAETLGETPVPSASATHLLREELDPEGRYL